MYPYKVDVRNAANIGSRSRVRVAARLASFKIPRSVRKVRTTSCQDAQESFQGCYLQDLIAHLRQLSPHNLTTWATSHREDITIELLEFIANEQENETLEHTQREKLWLMGAVLTSVIEGLEPVTTQALHAELRLAADHRSPLAYDNTPLSCIIKRTASLSLSSEGMELLQQQAMSLEAVINNSKAQSFKSIIGRKRLEAEEQGRMMASLAKADIERRILGFLMAIDDRSERSDALTAAFTPPTDEDCKRSDLDLEQVYTTPLKLMLALDIWRARLESDDDASSNAADSLLEGTSLLLSAPRILELLKEVKEDVVAYWEQRPFDILHV